ncbi:MAG: Hint domain-containing protein [Pseudomonadota bacterium]
MVLPAPDDAIEITVTGTATGFVSGNPPTDATGDLDGTFVLADGWTLSDATWSISNTPALGTATIDTDGTWQYVIDPAEFAALDDDETVSDTFDVAFTVFATNPDFLFTRSETFTQTITLNIEGVCFAAGTHIRCEAGDQRVETLRVGDLVFTEDSNLQPIRWIESNHLALATVLADPSLWPVRIRRGALGPGCPKRDLFVSQQHRMMLRSAKAELMFGAHEVLVGAKALCHLPGIDICMPTADVEYVHLLFDHHEIVDAEGAPAESLFLGEETLCAMTSDGLQELAAIFPQTDFADGFCFGTAARKIIKHREARALA